ncbi:MAG TPA: DUF488 domain-containing protein [Acidobacteriaceae bacterium]|nr:DUF488 domain-containing protein [Acidobacteriaceae bacterium]
MINIKRAYDPPSASDGTRILVDRLWPRGISKDELKLDLWLKDVAPSAALRQWFSHDPERWTEFQRRYLDELKQHPDTWKPILEAATKYNITLIFGSKDTAHNNAVVLQKFLDPKLHT